MYCCRQSRTIRRIVADCTLLAFAIAAVLALRRSLLNSRVDSSTVAVDVSTKRVEVERSRTERAEDLRFDGRHQEYLSKMLVDVFGFASRCDFPPPAGAGEAETGAGPPPKNTVILLISDHENAKLRQAIRATWANSVECRKYRAVVRFVLGKSAVNEHLPMLEAESQAFGDILVGDFRDSEQPSTVKSLLGLRWALTFCTEAEYIIQGTDETFIQLEKLPMIIDRFFLADRSVILGCAAPKTEVTINLNTDSVPYDTIPDKFYPTYCRLVSGFMMTLDLARAHFEYAWTSPTLVPLADALVGFSVVHFGWKIKHNYAFSRRRLDVDDPCPISRMVTALAPHKWDDIPAMYVKLRDREVMKRCRIADPDVISRGREANYTTYFQSVLKPAEYFPHVSCKDQAPLLLVLITSHVGRQTTRDTIRQTWANKDSLKSLSSSVKVFFLVGQSSSLDQSFHVALKEEAERYKDVIHGDFIDTFKNLTIKHLFGLSWAMEYCAKARFILKGDDDVFINLGNIVRLLEGIHSSSNGGKNLYMGDGGMEVRVRKDDNVRYVSSKEYDGTNFPDFCVGSGYVLSADLLPFVLREATRTRLLSSRDDVYIGILMKRLHVPLSYNSGFMYERKEKDACALREKGFMLMHVHGRNEELQEMWDRFMDENIICKTKS